MLSSLDKIQNFLVRKESSHFKYKGYISPQELRDLSSREIGKRLVSRIRNECEINRNETKGKSVKDEATLLMRVPSSAIDSIINYGLHNQHYTKTSGGDLNIDQRLQEEARMSAFSLGYSSNARKVLPKYSLLDLKSIGVKTFLSDEEIGQQYGDVIFSFKEEVKQRTTWTLGDSLGLSGYKNNKISFSLDFQSKNFPDKCMLYCEAQIWGELDFSDVDHVLIPEGMEVPDSLKRLGISVYQIAKSETSTRVQKGKMIYSGGETQTLGKKNSSNADELNPAEKNIVGINNLQKMNESELEKRFLETKDKNEKRAIVGEMSLKQTADSKKFLIDLAKTVNDQTVLTDILIGLSPYGDDTKVRELFLQLTPSCHSIYCLQTLSAIIASTEGFNQDKALLNKMKEFRDTSLIPLAWYDYLFSNKPLCK